MANAICGRGSDLCRIGRARPARASIRKIIGIAESRDVPIRVFCCENIPSIVVRIDRVQPGVAGVQPAGDFSNIAAGGVAGAERAGRRCFRRCPTPSRSPFG